ncbi:hypothetical protein ACVWY9_002720 [Thermostichus sp. OS-CIW-31]
MACNFCAFPDSTPDTGSQGRVDPSGLPGCNSAENH